MRIVFPETLLLSPISVRTVSIIRHVFPDLFYKEELAISISKNWQSETLFLNLSIETNATFRITSVYIIFCCGMDAWYIISTS